MVGLSFLPLTFFKETQIRWTPLVRGQGGGQWGDHRHGNKIWRNRDEIKARYIGIKGALHRDLIEMQNPNTLPSISPSECAQSNGCHNRLLYLDLCTIILTVFSRSFFKQHFFSPALALGNVSPHLSLFSPQNPTIRPLILREPFYPPFKLICTALLSIFSNSF